MFFKSNTNEADFVMIGDKKVEVQKLSIKKWRQIFGALNQLPGIVISTLTTANTQDIGALVIAAADICFGEIVEILSIASGLDKAYIEDNASLDEIIDYIERLVAKNNVQATLKKLMTAGAMFLPKLATEKADQQA